MSGLTRVLNSTLVIEWPPTVILIWPTRSLIWLTRLLIRALIACGTAWVSASMMYGTSEVFGGRLFRSSPIACRIFSTSTTIVPVWRLTVMPPLSRERLPTCLSSLLSDGMLIWIAPPSGRLLIALVSVVSSGLTALSTGLSRSASNGRSSSSRSPAIS